MGLTEFGKAIGRGQDQEAGQRECIRAEADFASHCINGWHWDAKFEGRRAIVEYFRRDEGDMESLLINRHVQKFGKHV